MDHLWSPWRYRYITGGVPAGGCVFCVKGEEGDDEANLVVARGRSSYALLNLYPYTNGHLLIAPYAHVAELGELDGETAAEMMAMTQQAVRTLGAVYRAEGFNCGF